MALGMKVGLGPGDFVFDGDPATPEQRAHPPHPAFGTCLLRPNGCMDEDATWYGSRPRPRPHCVRRDHSYAGKGQSSPPSFRPMSTVATVAHLSYCWALVNIPEGLRFMHCLNDFCGKVSTHDTIRYKVFS